MLGLGSCILTPATPLLIHHLLLFFFSQWRVFLPSLKFEVIDSSYISLYTGKGQVPPAATASRFSRGCMCWERWEGKQNLANWVLGAHLSL